MENRTNVLEALPSRLKAARKTKGLSLEAVAQVSGVSRSMFKADGSLRSQPHSPGTQEQITVLEGEICVRSGTAEAHLHQGDTARYAADVPHEITACASSARVFLIVKSG
jgi:quercetin dioxygenase-like cupin family protein